jgi:hypothetical protein
MAKFAEFTLQDQLALDCSAASILTPFATLFEPLYDPFASQCSNGAVFSGSFHIPVVCWSVICGLGSIEIGSLGPISTLPLDHKAGFPESQFGLLPDINKPPLYRVRVDGNASARWPTSSATRGFPLNQGNSARRDLSCKCPIPKLLRPTRLDTSQAILAVVKVLAVELLAGLVHLGCAFHVFAGLFVARL